jgi:ribosomal protein S6
MTKKELVKVITEIAKRIKHDFDKNERDYLKGLQMGQLIAFETILESMGEKKIAYQIEKLKESLR